MIFKSNYRLMQVKSIAECSKGSILQYFQPSLSYHLSLRSLFCLFLCGRLRQVLLYMCYCYCYFLSDSNHNHTEMFAKISKYDLLTLGLCKPNGISLKSFKHHNKIAHTIFFTDKSTSKMVILDHNALPCNIMQTYQGL